MINKGFSLIELLIALAILSVLALMVSRLMVSTTAAYRKNKERLELQSDAGRVMTQLSDAICQATYIRVQSDDLKDYQLVPDNYGNYVNPDKDNYRKVVLEKDTFKLVNNLLEDSYYPLDNDLDCAETVAGSGVVIAPSPVRSFRTLKDETANTYKYVKANYIYIEYVDVEYVTDATGKKQKQNVNKSLIYKWSEAESSLRMVRKDKIDLKEKNRYAKAKLEVDALKDNDGLITDLISSFKLSANVDEECILTQVEFKNNKYTYSMNEPINFRNSNVLTVSPQKLFRTIKSSTKAEAPVKVGTPLTSLSIGISNPLVPILSKTTNLVFAENNN